MKLIQCRFSSGQRVPLLVQDGLAAPLPKLVPFIYVQLKLRHRAYNTAAAHLRAIQAFYTYAKSRELDIDDAILACHFEAILALLDGYAIWLQSGRQADNLVARIGTAKTASFPQIDPRTRDQYLRLLKQYLSWCVTRYIPRARQNSTTLANIEVVFADVADVIERRFESHIINARPDHARYRSLTDTQLRRFTVTKSADQGHASPSSSLPAYVFEGQARVAIRTRTNDQPRYADTRLNVWTWYGGGVALKIDWAELDLTPEFNEMAKAFMAYALEKYAPQTAFMLVR